MNKIKWLTLVLLVMLVGCGEIVAEKSTELIELTEQEQDEWQETQDIHAKAQEVAMIAQYKLGLYDNAKEAQEEEHHKIEPGVIIFLSPITIDMEEIQPRPFEPYEIMIKILLLLIVPVIGLIVLIKTSSDRSKREKAKDRNEGFGRSIKREDERRQ